MLRVPAIRHQQVIRDEAYDNFTRMEVPDAFGERVWSAGEASVITDVALTLL